MQLRPLDAGVNRGDEPGKPELAARCARTWRPGSVAGDKCSMYGTAAQGQRVTDAHTPNLCRLEAQLAARLQALRSLQAGSSGGYGAAAMALDAHRQVRTGAGPSALC